jgi:hypothetical protein
MVPMSRAEDNHRALSVTNRTHRASFGDNFLVAFKLPSIPAGPLKVSAPHAESKTCHRGGFVKLKIKWKNVVVRFVPVATMVGLVVSLISSNPATTKILKW